MSMAGLYPTPSLEGASYRHLPMPFLEGVSYRHFHQAEDAPTPSQKDVNYKRPPTPNTCITCVKNFE